MSANKKVDLKDSYMLRISGRLALSPFLSIADAVAKFNELRDESGEGASTWPDGFLLAPTDTYRISYNGRVWRKDGTELQVAS